MVHPCKILYELCKVFAVIIMLNCTCFVIKGGEGDGKDGS